MDEQSSLTAHFEANRSRLQAVAYRMLGSTSEAEDAVQETWLRLNRAGSAEIENLGGWLTTVVARICLDMLRARKSHREDSLDEVESLPKHTGARPLTGDTVGSDPEQEAILADSVGLALLVLLDALAPAERLAFVLHDLFAVPFDEIAPIVGRSPEATRQLASRARRRVQGTATPSSDQRTVQREVVAAFLAAARGGDFAALLALLDPEVVLRVEGPTAPYPLVLELQGAAPVIERARHGFVPPAQLALIDGAAGLIYAPHGRLQRVLRFTVAHGKITEIEAIADPERLRRFDLAPLDG